MPAVRIVLAALLAALAFAVSTAPAVAAPVPENAVYTEEYFPSGDGTMLHADVFRPKGVEGEVPVIVTISPYTSHGGQTSYDPNASGPSSRFYDLLELGEVLERGYAYAMVDLRGYGGSGGCGDWGGPGEQMDARAAVEHFASRDWSNGKVGTYGKSYDGWTGLMALAQRPKGLAAVVSQEPVYDGYRYLHMNRISFAHRLRTPVGFREYDLKPGARTDTPQYHLNATLGTLANPTCYVENIVLAQDASPETSYWKPRNLVPKLRGVTVPTLLTQGFLETNTKLDAAFDAWNALEEEGKDNQAIFGQFDHVRVNDRDADDRPHMGREGLMDQVMRFFGEHLKGDKPGVRDPKIAVQDGTGAYREEQAWPPKDAEPTTVALKTGSITDTGTGRGTGSNVRGLWTVSQPLAKPAHFAGVPRVTVDTTTTAPDANLVADIYSVDPSGQAIRISWGGFLLPASGTHSWDLYGQDWRIPAGHRIAVLLTHANDDWYAHKRSDATITVKKASVALPFLANERHDTIDGTGTTQRLEQHLGSAFALPAQAESQRSSKRFRLKLRARRR